MSSALTANGFLQAIKTLEALSYKEISLVATNGDTPLKVFNGYDKIDTELANLTTIHLLLNDPEFTSADAFNPAAMHDSFDDETLKNIRKTVVEQFGQDIWPEDKDLDFELYVMILDACNNALEQKSKTVVEGIRDLRWEFSESCTSDKIQAINECDLIAPFERLKATLIDLTIDSKISDAYISLRSVSSLKAFEAADNEVKTADEEALKRIPFDNTGFSPT